MSQPRGPGYGSTMRHNDFGQPIGDAVPGWEGRASVIPTTLVGRHVRLLLERSESLQPLWSKARLEGLLLEDVLQTSAGTEPALDVQRVV